jgi:hypothetical protein
MGVVLEVSQEADPTFSFKFELIGSTYDFEGGASFCGGIAAVSNVPLAISCSLKTIKQRRSRRWDHIKQAVEQGMDIVNYFSEA